MRVFHLCTDFGKEWILLQYLEQSGVADGCLVEAQLWCCALEVISAWSILDVKLVFVLFVLRLFYFLVIVQTKTIVLVILKLGKYRIAQAQ